MLSVIDRFRDRVIAEHIEPRRTGGDRPHDHARDDDPVPRRRRGARRPVPRRARVRSSPDQPAHAPDRRRAVDRRDDPRDPALLVRTAVRLVQHRARERAARAVHRHPRRDRAVLPGAAGAVRERHERSEHPPAGRSARTGAVRLGAGRGAAGGPPGRRGPSRRSTRPRTWATVVRSMPDAVDGLRDRPVVVSDGSTDRTAAVAREAGAFVTELPINRGGGPGAPGRLRDRAWSSAPRSS